MEPSAADIHGRDLPAGPEILPRHLLAARASARGGALAREVREALGLQRRHRAAAGER